MILDSEEFSKQVSASAFKRRRDMACKITIKHSSGSEATWNCKWDIINHSTAPCSFQSADLTIECLSEPSENVQNSLWKGAQIIIESPDGSPQELVGSDLDNTASLKFLLECLSTTIGKETKSHRNVKFIAPSTKGNIIRSDIVPLRMSDLEIVERVVSLASPLQQFEGEAWTPSTSLSKLLLEAAGALLLRPSSNAQAAEADLRLLQLEAHNRLSLPLVAEGLRRRTVAFLEGSGVHPSRGGTAENIYGAAHALGIDMLVLAAEGHWLQTDKQYFHWRKWFVPVKFGFDDEFSTRIVDAIKQSGVEVEGLYTTFDCFQCTITMAATDLGLPCEVASAFWIATNKYRMSDFEGHRAFRATSIDEALHIAENNDLPWPIIVKPCNGWGSEDVFKVDSIVELRQQVARMNSDRHGTEFVMEHYCDGPEVDVNIVMYDGEITFLEIGDEYPKGAESGTEQSFHEMDTCSPSQLPPCERTLLREHFAKTLRRLGFKNGIFHCEARVENSAYEWVSLGNGMNELRPKLNPPSTPPSVWVIEVNPRPPGMKATGIVETTYGVDYWGLITLMALRDGVRVKALSQQFRDGAQYHGDMMFISASFDDSKQGIWVSGDAVSKTLEEYPHLAKHVSRSMTFIKDGDLVPKPSSGVNTFVAYLNIFSRRSRREALEVAREFREKIIIEYK